MSHQMDYTSGPVGRASLLHLETIPDRGFPTVSRLHNFSLSHTESIIVEANVAEMLSRDFRVYFVSAHDCAPLNRGDIRGTLQFIPPDQNELVPVETRVKRTDMYHVLARPFVNNVGHLDPRVEVCVSHGGDTVQYNEAPYQWVQRFYGFKTKFEIPVTYAKCFAFRFELDPTPGDVGDLSRIPGLAIENTPPATDQWLDTTQVTISQQRLGKMLTINFRFVEGTCSDNKVTPKLFDIVGVEPGEIKWEENRKVQVTEYVITLRELKTGWWDD